MIERQKIDGRDASVAYLTADLNPAEKDTAELIKVTFEDDLSSLWLTPQPSDDAEEQKEPEE